VGQLDPTTAQTSVCKGTSIGSVLTSTLYDLRGSNTRCQVRQILTTNTDCIRKKGKGSPYSITKRRVPELISVLGSQHAGDVSHKPGGRLPLHSVRLAVTPATLKRAATNFAAW